MRTCAGRGSRKASVGLLTSLPMHCDRWHAGIQARAAEFVRACSRSDSQSAGHAWWPKSTHEAIGRSNVVAGWAGARHGRGAYTARTWRVTKKPGAKGTSR